MTLASSEDEAMALVDVLRDGLFIDGDWVESKDQDPLGDVRLIQLADVGDGIFRDRSSRFLTREKAVELRCTFLEPGDVLVARMPEPLGRACIFPGVGQPAVTVVDVCVVRPNLNRIRPEWLVKAINSPRFRSSMQEFVRGTTRQRISRRNLGSLRLGVPTLDEQISVSSLIDEIEQRRSSARDHVAGAHRAVERFRQAVLANACTGRLTADWREANGSASSGEALVESIASARRARLGRKYKPSPVPQPDVVLPDRWTRASLGSLVDVSTGATPLRKRSDYYDGSIPWVTSGAVNRGLITEASERITELAIKETNAKVFPAGTLVVAMYGEGQTRGRVAELGIDAATNQALAALLFDETSEGLRPYLHMFLLENYERSRRVSLGGVQPNLSLGAIREMALPLPPIDEQVEIVRRVDRLLASAKSIKQRIDGASQGVERSAQAVLAKAFRGELAGAGASGAVDG